MLEPQLRHPLDVPQAGLEQLAEAVGLLAELLAEEGPGDDAADRRRAGSRRRRATPRPPGGEGPVDLGDDEAQVGVDPLDREGGLHEAAAALVVVAVGHHQGGGAVDGDEGLHGLAPLEAAAALESTCSLASAPKTRIMRFDP